MEYIEGRIFTDVRMPEIKTKEERTAWSVPEASSRRKAPELTGRLQLEVHRQDSCRPPQTQAG